MGEEAGWIALGNEHSGFGLRQVLPCLASLSIVYMSVPPKPPILEEKLTSRGKLLVRVPHPLFLQAMRASPKHVHLHRGHHRLCHEGTSLPLKTSPQELDPPVPSLGELHHHQLVLGVAP